MYISPNQGAYRTAEIPFDWDLDTLQDARLILAVLRAPLTDAAHRLDYRVRLVGGWVRDLLLIVHKRAAEATHRKTDVDLVVEGDARELGKLLQGKWGGTLLMHDPFLTAMWRPDMQGIARDHQAAAGAVADISLDLITARSETYPRPGQLPQVVAGTFAQDTARRDLSINTFALDLEDWPGFQAPPASLKVHFHPGALTDLRNGCLRLLHAASLRDDPTRIFRMARYAQRFSFHMEPVTAGWLAHAMQSDVLATVTRERLRVELEQVLGEDRAVQVLRRLQEWGVLQALGLNPDPERLWPALARAGDQTRQDREVAWLLLLGLNQDIAHPSAWRGRLHLPASTERAVIAFRHLANQPWNGLRPSQVWQRLQSTTPAVRLALRACLPEQSVTLDLYEDRWQHVATHINGRDLVRLGYRPGPQIGRLLEQLRSKTLDGELHSEEQELDWVQRTLGPPPGT